MSSQRAPELPRGTRLGRYVLRHKLAEGGMATVYLAQLEGSAGFERWVAIKVVHPQMAADRKFATMLLDEARMAARIHHPHVCAVLDFGEHDGLLYLVMEYLQGETLSAALRRGWGDHKMFPAWLAARVLSDAARGLHAAHELTGPDGEPLKLVHRDVSPQNVVVLYDGVAKMVDFGIASAKGRLTITKAGEVKGKLSYLAPEQVNPHLEVDRRVDVWALGVVLWESTMGRRLFKGATPGATLKQVVKGPIPWPTEHVPGYPRDLEAIVMKALERDRDQRFQTAAELADALEAYIYGLGKPAGHPQVSRWMKKLFDDRLLVRQALLESSTTTADLSTEDLRSETSLGGKLLSDSASFRSGAFAAPETTGPTVIEVPKQPATTPLASREDTARIPRDRLGRDVDEVLSEMRAARRWSMIIAGVGVVALVAAVVVVLKLGANEPAPTPASAPTATETSGTLFLRAEPAATVTLGDRTLGDTPLDAVSLPAGDHVLVLRPVGGGPSATARVTIRPGEPTTLDVRLRE